MEGTYARPIVEGCKVIMVGNPVTSYPKHLVPRGIGEAVEWLGYYEGPKSITRNAWAVAFPGHDGQYVINQRCLMRIDDPDIERQLRLEQAEKPPAGEERIRASMPWT